MTYIVYLTGGEYSGYGVTGIMVGEADAEAILDGIANDVSGGRWKCWDDVPTESDRRLSLEIRQAALLALIAAGFRKVEATEVWLG